MCAYAEWPDSPKAAGAPKVAVDSGDAEGRVAAKPSSCCSSATTVRVVLGFVVADAVVMWTLTAVYGPDFFVPNMVLAVAATVVAIAGVHNSCFGTLSARFGCVGPNLAFLLLLHVALGANEATRTASYYLASEGGEFRTDQVGGRLPFATQFSGDVFTCAELNSGAFPFRSRLDPEDADPPEMGCAERRASDVPQSGCFSGWGSVEACRACFIDDDELRKLCDADQVACCQSEGRWTLVLNLAGVVLPSLLLPVGIAASRVAMAAPGLEQ